jgi:hypothetical protein
MTSETSLFRSRQVLRSGSRRRVGQGEKAMRSRGGWSEMRKRLIYKSVSGNPVLNGELVQLNFVTDPAFNVEDVTVEMSMSELERLHRRIADRLLRQKQH